MSEYLARRDLVCTVAEPGWNYGYARSPFYKYDVENGATFSVYNGRLLSVSLATVSREEGYWATRRSVMRHNAGEMPVEVLGPDAGRLLDRLFTRRVSGLAPGRCSYGLACWPDGGIIVDGVVIRHADDRFWYVQAAGDFVGWSRGHALELDVQIRDTGAWGQQLQGPKALELLADIADDGAPEPFRYFDAREITIAGQPVLITRTGWTGELGFELYTRPGIDTDAIWERVTTVGTAHGLVDVGIDSMDPRRIEAAILNSSSDMDATTTPFDVGLGGFVDLEREDDFFGKEALRTADRRTRLYGIRAESVEPLIGGPVSRDGRQIGYVSAASWSPYLNAGIGFVRLLTPDDAEPRSAVVTGFDLEEHPCEIVDLPFYDPDKRIPRGLDVISV